jgi:hypothetical protein
MSRYFAEIDSNNIVTRVIVAHDIEWCQETLGGTWIETADPYSAAPQEVVYCGPGYGADETFPEKFAPPWVMPAPDPETGVWSSYAKGAVGFHDGHLWKSTTDGNMWQPGISAWHNEPAIDGVLPKWIQPTGAHDTYPLGAEVTHNGKEWVSDHAANVWEPGVSQWREKGAPPVEECPAWKAWDGHNASLYQVGDCVTHNGQEWLATTGNNHWEPGVFGWALK